MWALMSGFSCWSSVFEHREAKGAMKQKKRDREDNHPTNNQPRYERRALGACRAPPAAAGVARAPRSSRAVPGAGRAPCRPAPLPAVGVGSGARARSERRRWTEAADRRVRRAATGPPESAHRAESPRVACVAQRRTCEGSLARLALDAAPHRRAEERGLTPPRGAQGRTDGRRENDDLHHHTHAARPARLRRREPPDRPTYTGARARAARAPPVAMRAGHGLAPRGAASEWKPRDDDDADR